jgi:hypothetical protein
MPAQKKKRGPEGRVMAGQTLDEQLESLDDPAKPWNSSALKPAPFAKPKPKPSEAKGDNRAWFEKLGDRMFGPKRYRDSVVTDPEEIARRRAKGQQGIAEAYGEGSPATRVVPGAKAAEKIDDPEFRKLFDEELKITPTDKEGAKARAQKRMRR